MAKLAASEAATAIAHQVTSFDTTDTRYAERDFVILPFVTHKCLGKVG